MASVTFEHLTKTYPNGFVSVDDVNLHIEDGEFVVFHGPSGCGKSSLIKVIDRLEKGDGSVYIGGHELSQYSRNLLAKNLALVPQSPFLIADTVYHNICYGIDREVSMLEVEQAAKKANIAVPPFGHFCEEG